MHVCDNVGEHLVGNVYAKFREEEDAARALTALQVRLRVVACCVLLRV